MAKIKLPRTVVETAQPQAKAIELRDTVVPGFLCKITQAGRQVFMLLYRTNTGERRKPALGPLGLFGELTVEQPRIMAQDWLAEVRRGGAPDGAKAEARKAPTMAELCRKFMEDYSRKRNKPSTQGGYQGVIGRNNIPLLGRRKVQDVKRPDIAWLMQKLAHKANKANKMFNPAEMWGFRPDGTNRRRHVTMFPPGKETRLIVDDELVRVFRQLEKQEAEGLENIANSGVPIKIGMKLTGHRTVATFVHYIHTEDKPVREAAELVVNRRKAITGAPQAEGVAA
ncbi:MAG: integrase arm-type DNA-binding domain-containing protein [Alphaproteobacteria bacterium]|nr:integrase arm-type DNA-binding domain-containing protein [Alphaproteobacteria bacterium]